MQEEGRDERNISKEKSNWEEGRKQHKWNKEQENED